MIDYWQEHGFGLWAVEDKESGRLIGRCVTSVSLYMLSINTQHSDQLGTDERNEAIKRALRLGLPHSYRQLAALFNCSETHVMHLSHLVEVEDHYKGYLASEGLPQNERDLRQQRLAEMSDSTLLKVREAPLDGGVLPDRPLCQPRPSSRLRVKNSSTRRLWRAAGVSRRAARATPATPARTRASHSALVIPLPLRHQRGGPLPAPVARRGPEAARSGAGAPRTRLL
jgi:hypothetical protein